MVGIDIFTGKKYEDIYPVSQKIMVPEIKKVEYEVAYIDENDFVSLILPDSSLKENVKLPQSEDLKEKLNNLYRKYEGKAQIYFTIMSSCGE